jgi:F0F1-type ATP synthase assembly protein I
MGDGLSTGFELAGTIIVAFLIGWGLDTWLGTTPWCMVGLTLLAVVAKLIVVYYQYDAKMQDEERKLQARRGTTRLDAGEDQR